jgi:hypothetical protein
MVTVAYPAVQPGTARPSSQGDAATSQSLERREGSSSRGVGHHGAVPPQGTVGASHDDAPGTVDWAGSLRVKVVWMGCPPSAKPPMAGRAVSTRYAGAVVDSVGVGSERVVVASACGVRGPGLAGLEPSGFTATATPSARATTATYTQPRGRPGTRGAPGSTSPSLAIGRACHRTTPTTCP